MNNFPGLLWNCEIKRKKASLARVHIKFLSDVFLKANEASWPGLEKESQRRNCPPRDAKWSRLNEIWKADGWTRRADPILDTYTQLSPPPQRRRFNSFDGFNSHIRIPSHIPVESADIFTFFIFVSSLLPATTPPTPPTSSSFSFLRPLFFTFLLILFNHPPPPLFLVTFCFFKLIYALSSRWSDNTFRFCVLGIYRKKKI